MSAITPTPQGLNKEFNALKPAVLKFDHTTLRSDVITAKEKLEGLQVQLREIVQKNPQAVMTLAVALHKKNGVEGLLNKCKALLTSELPATSPIVQKEPVLDTTNASNEPITASKTHKAVSRSMSKFDVLKGFNESFSARTKQRSALPDNFFSPPEQKSVNAVQQTTPCITSQENKPAAIVTEIKVKCRIPYGHTLKIHGEGANLDWSKGADLQKMDEETYVYRYQGNSGPIQFKFVVNDTHWENCDNRTIEAGAVQEFQPAWAFPLVPVVINCDANDGELSLRGTGPGMSWEEGVPLKKSHGKWVLETNSEFEPFECKVVRNGVWEQGENHKVEWSKTLEINPKF